MTTRFLLRTVPLLASLAAASGVSAQSADSAASPAPAAPASAVAPSVSTAEPATSDWRFVGRMTGTVTHDNNVFIQRTGRRADTYFHLAPTFAYGIGAFRTDLLAFTPIPHGLTLTGEEDLPRKDYAYASYTPDVVIFSKYHHENTVNHDVQLAAREERDLWTAQARLRYQRILDTNIDVGARLRQTYYTLDASGWHALTGKTNVSVNLNGNRTEYSGGFASTDLRLGSALEYQIAPKTAVGVGANVGHLTATQSSSQTYEQPLLQVRYDPTGKLSFTGRAGMEFRQYHSDLSNRSRFVYSLGAGYQPSDSTVASLTAGRETISSAQYASENIVADSVQGQLRQRLFTRLFGAISGGYVRDRYEANRANTGVRRRDQYYFGKISASHDITRHGTIELSYEYRENDSTVHPFGFTQNLTTLAASFLY